MSVQFDRELRERLILKSTIKVYIQGREKYMWGTSVALTSIRNLGEVLHALVLQAFTTAIGNSNSTYIYSCC